MGERPRSLGISGEYKAWDFLRALGYKIHELNNEEYNIDCTAGFPPKATTYGLLRPRYSPEGLTAFEITTEGQLRRKKINDFEAKITKYNADNPAHKINGGVLLIDQKIHQPMRKMMESKRIFGWGIHRQCLYLGKIRVFKKWRKQFYVRSVCEIPLSKEITYLRCSTPPPTRSDKLLYFAVFYDDHSQKLHAKHVIEIMGKLKDVLIPIVKSGVIPLNVHFEFHTIGGVSATKEDVLEDITEKWTDYGIQVQLPQDAFKDYRIFPALPMEASL